VSQPNVSQPNVSRLNASALLRLHVVRRLGERIGADDDLLARARLLTGEPVGGLAFDPPYPGATAGVERVGDTVRLVLGCVAYRRGEPVGVAFTTLIPDRPPQVSVAPLVAGIPTHWRPLA
jgi:hypothetical protein